MLNSASGPKYAVVATPLFFRNASALRATYRGSREYGSRVIGSTISQVSESVGTCRHGSTNALAASGSSSMSLSLIAWKPRIDDPSNPSPSVNVYSSSSFNGIEKCCQVPGRSVKHASTICTPASLARRMTSAGDVPVDTFPPTVAVGSNVAVIVGDLLPESGMRGASGGPCGKVEDIPESVNQIVHELQEKSPNRQLLRWKAAN